ncbi:3-phosphoshikimate 1-carboxyvinyltransferase [Mobilitalea sibirica]|uniref:3-phosphoshikimate 1-carboxyvinyltransferase n=1 Tax=Mobilitalea sibirica TaxID=1462919 RepID=A0A8J7H8X3_9FIRM|nr:3-phosphoshikimate 1-carboxyvinyltransferase [Mobilitalea sibirica]MBH1940610.1 3-phosphoshikimate 1-carboxyvinyltransferase [Mobilitalea sibirica]
MIFVKNGPLKGCVTVPGDKSISHRAVMFGALANGTTEITNFLHGADCLSTIRCFRQLGIEINNQASSDTVTILGKGLYGLRKPDQTLDVGNSGTTMRLISGILCGQDFAVTLTGDESIRRRPMGRIIAPLKQMGADIESAMSNHCAPLLINCTADKMSNLNDMLTGIRYQSPVASAQVKSCILLAGLYAEGETSVTEPYISRNHTELMLSQFGAAIRTKGNTVTILPGPYLEGRKISVPGDISSAAYFIAAGLMVPNSEVLIKNVGINPTRDGMLKVCKQMGADLTLDNIRDDGGEPVADIVVRHSELKGIEIGGDIIPTLIDEIPMISILACFAKGKTVIKDASELKVKESNRIDVMVENLTKMGADITATEDGMIINGGKPLHGATIESKLDHRIAMSFAVAALMAEGDTEILNAECVDISYPNFYTDLKKLYQSH